MFNPDTAPYVGPNSLPAFEALSSLLLGAPSKMGLWIEVGGSQFRGKAPSSGIPRPDIVEAILAGTQSATAVLDRRSHEAAQTR
jgi:hypothetical protein